MGAQGGPEYPCLNDDSLLFVWDPKNNKCWENGATSLITTNPLTGSMENETGTPWSFSAITSSAGGLLFDGTDDYIDFGDQVNWQFSSTGISACAWFYWDGTSQSTVISSKRKDASSYNNMNLVITNSTWYGGSAKKVGGLMLSDGTGYIQTAPDLLYDMALEPVGWHHVVVTADSNGTSYVYFDGVLKTTKVFGTGADGGIKSWGVSGGPFCIGAQYISSAAVPTWQSYLGPVYYYKRQISAAEVLKNYNVLKGRFGL
jgi:hypothetical protein